jgi:hypothetical protein
MPKNPESDSEKLVVPTQEGTPVPTLGGILRDRIFKLASVSKKSDFLKKSDF